MKYLKAKHSGTFYIKCFPSKAKQKQFTPDKILALVSFSFKEREWNVPCELHQTVKLTFCVLN